MERNGVTASFSSLFGLPALFPVSFEGERERGEMMHEEIGHAFRFPFSHIHDESLQAELQEVSLESWTLMDMIMKIPNKTHIAHVTHITRIRRITHVHKLYKQMMLLRIGR